MLYLIMLHRSIINYDDNYGMKYKERISSVLSELKIHMGVRKDCSKPTDNLIRTLQLKNPKSTFIVLD